MQNMRSFRMTAPTMGTSRNAMVFTPMRIPSKSAGNSCAKFLKNESSFGSTETSRYRPSMGLSSPARKSPEAPFGTDQKDREQRTEDRGQRTKDKGQRATDERWQTGGRCDVG